VPAKPNTQGAVPATTAPLYVISGTVTGTGGIPLGNIQVQASASSGPNFWAEETSVSNGLYRVLAPAGSYTLMFVDPTSAYLSGYYSIGGFTTVLGSATSITVGSSDVSGINLQLGKGHFIRGTVTTPVVGYSFTSLKVTAYGTGYTGDTTANPDGTYALDVPAGSYTVAFSDASGTYLNGYYSSGGFTTVPGSATGITVGTSDVIGINVTLVRGWFISGTVTGPGGTPLSNIEVDTGSTFAGTTTRVDGTYSLQVPSGTFTVRFYDYSGTYYTGYYSSGGFTVALGSATPITVGTSNVTGINVQMTATAPPPPNVTVTLLSSSIVAPVGSIVVLVALASQDVAPTNYWIVIRDSSGTILAVCGYSPTCTATVWSGAPASLRYYAAISQNDGSQPHSASSWGTVMWPGATYHALTPARILDSRDHTGGLGIFSSHVAQSFTVTGHGGVPVGATAVTGNLTVTQQTSGGFLYIGPVAANNPTSSTLNFPVGDDRANAVTVALGTGGTLSVTYAAATLGPTAQVIFDVTGYFTPDMTGATYHALTPSRILDSRDHTGGLGTFSSHVAQTFQVTGHGGVPANAVAVTGNVTVTQQTSGGFLSVGPVAQNNPTSSTLNFPLGDDRANAVTVALSGAGTLSVTYAAATLGPTAQVIFDVTGYFTPDMTGAIYVPLTPARILDTRNGTGGLGVLHSHVAQWFQGAGGGVPVNAVAVTGNLTVTQQTSAGFLYIGPAAMVNPTSSTLNFPVGDDRANAVTVGLGTGGTLSVTYAASTLGPTAHVIFDVTGYFVP
jgi:hypothetical protein